MSRISDALSHASAAARERGEVGERNAVVPATLPASEGAGHDDLPWSFEPGDGSGSDWTGAPIDVAPPEPPAERNAPLEPVQPTNEPVALPDGFNPMFRDRIVVAGGVSDYGIEQYRALAANLHQTQIDRGIRVIMITSAVLGEGKSLTSINLALTLSESYKRRVLLVDADLRRPSIHTVFQTPNVTGLSDGLRREKARTFATIEISETLALLPAGRPDPDPMASLTSSRMRQLLEEARTKFDWVIIDTPPVSLMPDANILASMSDAVLLVVRAGRAPFEMVKQAVKTIGRKKILGTVLNGTEDKLVQGYSGYGY